MQRHLYVSLKGVYHTGKPLIHRCELFLLQVHSMSIKTPGGFYVESCWTKAGIGSCVRVKSSSADVLFDCGLFEESIESASYVFISHSHTDHIGAVISHARARTLTRKPAKYYIPSFALDQLEIARKAFSSMDNEDIPMEIISVSPGDVIDCDGKFKVVVFETHHRVPSQGYALYSVVKGQLKEEYKNIESAEIVNLIKSGVEVHYKPREVLDVVYTGDTLMSGLLLESNKFIFSAAILITELTYLDGDYGKAIEWGHIHINDIVEHSELFKNVTQLIFVHISARYAPFSKALNLLNQNLPESLLSKTLVSLKSFGAPTYLSSPLNLSRDSVGWGWAREYDNSRHSNRSGSGYNNRGGRGGRHDTEYGDRRDTVTNSNRREEQRQEAQPAIQEPKKIPGLPPNWSEIASRARGRGRGR